MEDDILKFCQRAGLGVTVWRYQMGDKAAIDTVMQATKDNANRVNVFVPRDPDQETTGMKVFQMRELTAAVAHARAGGQSIHLHRFCSKKAPRCFQDAIARGEDVANLFDQNLPRLVATAKDLGVNVIKVQYEGNSWQHVDLCGESLKKALREAD